MHGAAGIPGTMSRTSRQLPFRNILCFLIIALLFVAVPGAAVETSLVSADSSGIPADYPADNPAISSDGRYVAFESDATNLVPGDTNGFRDIFLRDLVTGTITRVSVASGGTQANSDSYNAAISADGAWIVFESAASNLVAGDTNGYRDIFLHGRDTGLTWRVSYAPLSVQPNGDSVRPSIAAEGLWITYQSDATNLVSDDTNAATDIFLYDLHDGITTRVSVATDGTQANGDSRDAVISAEGSWIVFTSEATNLVAGDTNGYRDIFHHSRENGGTWRVSYGPLGVQPNGNCYTPTVSSNGLWIAYHSRASNLVPDDTNGLPDVFVYDMFNGLTARVSVATDGTQGNDYSEYPSISQSGRYVAFHSMASNLVQGDTNGQPDVFVRDLTDGTTTRVSVATDGTQGNSPSHAASISDDGRTVSYASYSSTLVPAVTGTDGDVYASVLQAPVAGFDGTPLTGTVPLLVQFNDTSSNAPAMWNWSSGDGTWFNTTDATARNATFTYTAPGTYTVNLTVSNAEGSDTASRTDYITAVAGSCSPVVTIGGSDSISDGIADTCDGGTLILNPGTYTQHDITIAKNITIRANTSYGGSAENTIIDAEGSGRIISSSSRTVILDSLSLQNGYIVPGGQTLGGAVVNLGTLTVNSSAFSHCTVGGVGGAIGNAGTLTVTSSTFTDCTATGVSPGGGAIANTILNGPSTATVSSSSFVDCTSELSGGAIVNGMGCTLDISSSTFSGCTASTYGGAIHSTDYSDSTVTSSTFSGCTAATGGGAIAVSGSASSLTVLSSDFDGCTAGSDGGGAVLAFPPVTIHFSRFYGNTATGSGTAVRFVSPSSDATGNWWGNNSGPGPAYYGNPDAVASWLMLGATADPAAIDTAVTSAIRFNLTYDSDGGVHAPSGGHVPDGIPGSWAVVAGSGMFSPDTGTTTDGANTTTFRPAGTGATNISATVDGQTVYNGVDVSAAPVTATTTAVYSTLAPDNDDGFPSATPTATQASTLSPMTVTVNIGGDSKAWQAVVTGTKLSDLIVTGTVQSGSGSNVTAPPGIVYQYISLVPARFAGITKAVIHFTVPQSWLDENHIDPKSIVLYHETANGWEALPTTVLSTKDGTAYFSAESGSFSLFAIAGMPTVLIPLVDSATQEIVSTTVQEQPLAPAAAAKAPAATQTTTPPATTPQPAAPSPLLNVILVIAAIGILAGGGFMIRRWWIHRQNPALFREYE